MDNKIEILEAQIRQIFASVVWTYKIQEKQADIYRERYNVMETVKIIISAITSAGIISIIFVDEFGLKFVTAIISMISIGITSYFKTFNFPELANQHKESALKLLRLREQLISVLCDIKMERIELEQVIQKRDDILERLAEVYDGCIDSSPKAVDKAKVALNKDKDFTYSESEIDSFLPIYLRKGDNNGIIR